METKPRPFNTLSLSEQSRVLAYLEKLTEVLDEVDPRGEIKYHPDNGLFQWVLAEAKRRVDNVAVR